MTGRHLFRSVAAALLCFVLLGGCTSNNTDKGADVPQYDSTAYLCAAPGRQTAVLPDGSTAEISADGDAIDGVTFVPREVITLLGGSVGEKKITVGPLTFKTDEIDFDPDGNEPIGFFRDTLGLVCDVYGDFVRIGFSPDVPDAGKRAEIRDTLGLDGAALPEIPVTAKETVIDPHVRVDHETLLAQCETLCEAYPELVNVFYPAQSVEGRDLPVITLGRGDRVIFYGGAIHASEFITTNVLMNMIDSYAAGYYSDECEPGYISYRDLLDSVTFYIVPQINPDGVNIAHNGYHASKDYPVWTYSRQGLGYASTYKANVRGVDLNRNFPYKWDPMKENGITWPCTKYFCGYEAASEPETVLMITLGQSLPWEMFADFHKYGETLYWIDTDSLDHRERFGHVAERMLSDSGYDDAGVESVEGFGGYCSNYMRNVYDRFACTVEVDPYYDWNESHFEGIAKNIRRCGLVMGEELLRMEDQAPGLTAFVNGRTVLMINDEGAPLEDGAIPFGAFRSLAGACGMDVGEAADYADIAVPAAEIPSGDLSVALGDGTAFNGTGFFARSGIGCEIDGSAVYLFFENQAV